MKNNCSPKVMRFFKAACNIQRQRILSLINKYRSLNASQIVKKTRLSQPTISHHLKILTEAELVYAQKKAKEVIYTINKKNIANCCIDFMKKMTSGKQKNS